MVITTTIIVFFVAPIVGALFLGSLSFHRIVPENEMLWTTFFGHGQTTEFNNEIEAHMWLTRLLELGSLNFDIPYWLEPVQANGVGADDNIGYGFSPIS